MWNHINPSMLSFVQCLPSYSQVEGLDSIHWCDEQISEHWDCFRPLEGLEGLGDLWCSLHISVHSQLSSGLLMRVLVHGAGSRCVCEAVDHLVDGLRMDQRRDLKTATLNAFPQGFSFTCCVWSAFMVRGSHRVTLHTLHLMPWRWYRPTEVIHPK